MRVPAARAMFAPVLCAGLASCGVAARGPAPTETARTGPLATRSAPVAMLARSRGVPYSSGSLERARAAAARPGVRRVVLFLPGYNTSLAASTVIAERLGRMLGGAFAVVDVDWGSKGEALDYEHDARAALRAGPAFAAFVHDLRAALPHEELDVFAHSMGARVAVGAFGSPALGAGGLVRHVVLAAPDLTLKDYVQALERRPPLCPHVTIYISRRDDALWFSALVHFHRRLGQLALRTAHLPGSEVVDASAAERVAEGHGYAIHDPAVVRDIACVFNDCPVPHASWVPEFPSVWALRPPSAK
jgi:esterase/lipase superfamily enzyme